jgi:hypothetical protein
VGRQRNGALPAHGREFADGNENPPDLRSRTRILHSPVHSNAATKCGRALRVTKALLQSKLRQIAEEEQRKKQKRNRKPPDKTGDE